ncbi:MAG: S-layer protein/S-layer protein [Candidatus Methanomarinus sp.]|nr:MAG: S-layer protein/S-layer protein [ANME-2 cluster archaeon]
MVGLRKIFIGLMFIAFTLSIVHAIPDFNIIEPEDANPSTFPGENPNFIVHTNETVNFTWYINEMLDVSEINNIESTYPYKSEPVGNYNVTVVIENINGKKSHEWNWSVNRHSEPNFTSTSPNTPHNTDNGTSQEFSIQIDQPVNVTWYLNDIEMDFISGPTYSSSFINTSPTGPYVVKVLVQNQNGTRTTTWDWNVIEIPAPSIRPDPSNNPQSQVGIEESFSIEIDQPANITWLMNGTEINSEILETSSSYSNDTAPVGNYNITVNIENTNGKDSTTWIWSVVPKQVVITPHPSEKDVSTSEGESINFSIEVNQICDIKWFIGSEPKHTNESKRSGSFTTSNSAGDYVVKVEATNKTTKVSRSHEWNWKVNSKTYESGNRIWDEDEDMSDTYTWTPQSFSGFYYNLDTDEGKETLTIENIGDRSIDDGKIEYVTEPIVKEFECNSFGNYSVIGFMAERYFAGYEKGSIMNDGFSLLDEEILSRVLIDDDESQMIKSGIPLVLEEGYEFRVTEYAASGDDVMVALFKDGESIYETILSEGSTFTYEKDMGSADDIPIIALHVDTVFRGMETSTISIDGIFQISDDFINVEDGDEFGLMEIDGVDSGQITMVNSNDVSLKKGRTFNLMGKINIEVGNCDELRFALAVDTSEPGTYELRGTVTQDEKYTWTPLNFEGLLYDMDSGDKKETLYIERHGIDDRGISPGDLSYNTSPISMNFEYSGWNDYESIGFMGEKYFAGYEDNSIEEKGVSLMNKGYLGNILIDESEKHTLYVGNSLPLADGYSFRIDEISQDGDSIMVALLRDGEEIKSDIINDDSTYTHTKEVDDEDVPVIAIHIDNIFRGMETNCIFVNGIFQISEDFKKIEEGDSYGNMEIDSVTNNYIKMSNDGSMTLGKGDTISIMSDIKIKVADDDTVRFYPFQEIKVEALESLKIDFPINIYSNQEFTIKVTSDGDEVEGAYVSFGDIEIGATDSNGELVYTPTETGSFNITASKSGYNSDSSEIEVIFQPKALDITFPSVIDKNELLTILVTSEGSPLSGASVMFGSIDLGTTPSSGNISYTPDEIGTFTISASKSGYQDVSKDIDISDPSAKLVFTNLTINPEVVDPGQIVIISVDTANFGTLREAETVILNINEEEESTRDVTLGPGEISTITFSVNKSKSGKYDVEIGGLEGSFKVTGDSSISIIAMILLGIIGLFSVGAIVYSVSKGDLTFDSMTEKASEIEVKIKRLIEK